MCGNCAPKPPVTFTRRQVLAMCLGAPIAGGVIGYALGPQHEAAPPQEVAAPAPASAPTSVPRSTVAAAPGPIIEPFRGRKPVAWGTDLKGIVATVPTTPGKRTMALTFDACGGGAGVAVDTELLKVLHEFQVPATLFLNSRWIAANPDLTKQLIADPLFSIQNHGTSHLPLSVSGQSAYGIGGTATIDEALAEVEGNRHQVHATYGHAMTWFRSGTAHYDDVCVDMCAANGIRIAGFSTNMDAGATASASVVTAQILGAPDGAIGIGHMNHPGAGTAPGVRAALQQMRGVNFVKL